MKQKIILKHKNAQILAELGKEIINQWPNELAEGVNFDSGNLDDMERTTELRMPCLEFVCPNALSGEIIMLCVRLPGVQLDLKPLENGNK